MSNANLEKEKLFLEIVEKGLLEVQEDGRVFDSKGKEVGLNISSGGYYRVIKRIKRKRYEIQKHRLIWIVFKGIPEDPDLEINHKDGKKLNCRLDNLELITQIENARHAYEMGLTKPIPLIVLKGEESPNAILTNLEVKQFREDYREGKFSVKELANKLYMAQSGIYQMLTGQTFKEVEGAIKGSLKGYYKTPKIFSDEDVIKYRTMNKQGKLPIKLRKEIAKKFGIKYDTLLKMLRGERYIHVPI